MNSLRAEIEAERAGWNRERRQLTTEKTAAETAFKQADRKAKSLEAEFRELSQRQKYLERDRENLRRRKDDTEKSETSDAPSAVPSQVNAGPVAPIPEQTHRAPTPNAAGHAEDASDPDSVAVYMQRLLARNRKSKTEDDVSWIPERQKAAPVPKSVPTEESAKTIAAAVVETVRQQPVESVPLPGPSYARQGHRPRRPRQPAEYRQLGRPFGHCPVHDQVDSRKAVFCCRF